MFGVRPSMTKPFQPSGRSVSLRLLLWALAKHKETRFKEELKIEEPKIEEPKIEPCDHSGTDWNSPHHRGELTDAYTTNGPPRPQNKKNKDRQVPTRLGIHFCSDWTQKIKKWGSADSPGYRLL